MLLKKAESLTLPLTLVLVLTGCETPYVIGTNGVCNGLGEPMRELTTTLVGRGPELINEGFGDVLTNSEIVVTGYRSVCK